MGVRAHAADPLPRARAAGPGLGAIFLVVAIALALLLANGRPVGTPDTGGAASWLLRGAVALAGLAFRVDAPAVALVGKALAAVFAALAAGALFAAVARRHGIGEGRWAGLLLALGTTLAAAAQAWSGEAAATWAVALAVLLLVRSEDEESAGLAAFAGLPLGFAAALQASTAALVLVLLLAIVVRWRARGLLVLAWALPGATLAFASLATPPSIAPSPGRGLLVLLASPAKGALVFAPVALVGVAGLLRAMRVPARRLWDQPQSGRFLPVACGLAAAAHFAWLAVAGGGAAGDFWGPRGVAPAWPVLLLFLPEGFALLKIVASLLALASVAIQALGALTYDGRWDRLYRGPAGELGAAAWDVPRSPIPFQARERVARVARPGLEGGRLVVRERVLAPAGAAGSFLSFAKTPPAPTGVDRTMSAVRLEGGARVAAGRLELRAAGDALCFRVPPGSHLRRLEVRVTGRGQGTVGLAEGGAGKATRWRDRPVSGSFRLRLPYYFPDSGGPDLRVSLRAGGPIAIESVAVVPPSDPENVIRLP
ncbi:MAG TPA: hypothetical protein VLL75_06720 [Vicinamibacteria bacterium]|nr:hypothetical protein [Vicinamibacteria bacterium]